jgi:hypothetical protein
VCCVIRDPVTQHVICKHRSVATLRLSEILATTAIMGRLLHFCLCEFLAKLCASCKNIIVFSVYVVSGFQLLDFTRHPLSWTSLVCTTHDLGLDNDKHLCPSHLFQFREGGPKQVLSLFLVDTNFFCSSASPLK